LGVERLAKFHDVHTVLTNAVPQEVRDLLDRLIVGV
jgi:hypothetical protein